jgi:MOSC domain-containing protein YiiM
VNIGAATTLPRLGVTGIDKKPVSGPVEVRAPGPKGVGGSGLIGDQVCNRRHHGGDDQAVYAYAREDLDSWADELGRALPAGSFGENLTTTGIDITNSLIGERWRLGEQVVLEISVPRIPCRVFAGRLGERGWVKTFTARAVPGAYLRVIEPGVIEAGDPVRIVHRPSHDVTVGVAFRALTTERELLPRLLMADALPGEAKQMAGAGTVIELDDPA